MKEGTAEVVQAPMVVNGSTGQKISATGTIDGHTAGVDPIPIRNTFGEDMLWGAPSNQRGYTGAGPGTDVAFGMEWTLRTLVGSDPGPPNINFNLTITNSTNRSLTVGAPYLERAGCTAYNYGNVADGHPFSGRPTLPKQNAPFVKTCTLTHVSGNNYRLSLVGIDYSKVILPTLDSAGRSLGSTWQPVASGTIWLTLHNLRQETSVVLRQTSPGLYRAPAPSTRTYTDATGNNTSDKDLPLPGNWSASWNRGYTHSGGTAWDNTYKVPTLTKVQAHVQDTYGRMAGVRNTTVLGECAVLDYKYVSYVSSIAEKWRPTVAGTSPISGARFQYYTGTSALLNPNSRSYNPNAFSCDGNTGWTSTKPAASRIKAVRATWRRSAVAGHNARIVVVEQVRSNAPVGRDVWMWGSTLQGWHNSHWTNPARHTTTPGNHTRVPGSRYHYTTGARDVLHVTGPVPLIQKRANPTTITPGDPATFTLRYQLQGGPGLHFNGYKLVDVLPKGMTYVTGSATPTPKVTTNRSGQQVLTWTLNGVASNAWGTITYKAVASKSVTPGQALTNTVTATYGKQSAKASAQVTVSTSGYTTIAKTADAQYIPDLNGDGKGSGSWTVSLRSFDPTAQSFTDTIDILPYKGDGRGTSYHGSYTLTSVKPVSGAKVYYTTADPSTLSDDPSEKSNGTAPGSIAGNSVGWTTSYTPNATAVRVIGPRLAPGDEQQFKVTIATDGAKGGDLYVNRAQAIAGHTRLVMRTSAPITEAYYYAYTLKKYVQDADGDWHDANQASDYPMFHYGDTIHYRVVVKNVGEGTLTNIDVSDDKQPQLGAFHIDSLASGKSQSHEYSIKLDESVSGTVVNTACGKAQQPADMATPLQQQCDPAGFIVTNYTTVKTSDPAPGTPVSPGQVVKYTITVTQQGPAPADAMYSDDLTRVLDDATYDNDVTASLGTATYNGGKISWSGTVPVGEVATVTYTMTVKDVADLKKHGDSDLLNVVTSPGCQKASDCTVDHPVRMFSVKKSVSGKTKAQPGDKVTYTIVVTNIGKADYTKKHPAKFTDDLSKVLDDATYGKDAKASAGRVSYTPPKLTWSGPLAVGKSTTVTYSMTVRNPDHGNGKLDNAVFTPPGSGGDCPAGSDNARCSTHKKVAPAPSQPLHHINSGNDATTTGSTGTWPAMTGLILLALGAAGISGLWLRRRANR